MAMALLWPLSSVAATQFDTLYINRGEFVTIKKTSFPALAFNRSRAYETANALIVSHPGDTLDLDIINNDTAPHAFSLRSDDFSFTVIPSGGSHTQRIVTNNVGAYYYCDPLNYPQNAYMGLGGMIAVLPDNSKSYFWNIKEHELAYSNAIAQGQSVEWSKYDPDYFTINGKSFPDIELDSLAKIRASVGEKVYVFITNTGQSMHALHFHGFHCEVLASTNSNMTVGWKKDSFPVKRMSGVLLQLIPDKPGKYSVHDHNLVAITAGGTHPNGLFTIMEVQ